MALQDSLNMSSRHMINVIVESFVSNLIPLIASAPVIVFVTAVFLGYKLSIILYLTSIAAIVISAYVSSLLMTGMALGFVRVVLDDGRVFQSVRFGLGLALARKNHVRALAVGMPLFVIFVFCTLAGYFAGVEAI